MPPDPFVSAIVSTVISTAVEGMLNAPSPQPVPDLGIVRLLPEDTRIGTMTATNFSHVTLDGKQLPLSPGVQIRNELNILIMPSMVAGPARVRYQLDAAGFVYRLWILSPTEARLPENR